MKLVSTYNIHLVGLNRNVEDTLRQYRAAVDFLITVIDDEWNDVFTNCNAANDAVRVAEALCLQTHKRPTTPYNFSAKFGHFPSYLRRAAIAQAYGMVKSYQSNLKNWYNQPKSTRGKRPQRPVAGYSCPSMYKDNMYQPVDEKTARIKLFTNGNWNWVTVNLKHTDVAYIQRHCVNRTQLSPTLVKKGKRFALAFPFEENIKLTDTPVEEQIAVAVDLGVNNACTCTVMDSNGNILTRKFLKTDKEQREMERILKHIGKVQRSGWHKTPLLWARVRNINRHIAEKTALFIQDLMIEYSAHVVVFEHLDVRGKKHGGKKQRLHHWRADYVQKLVEHKAHRLGGRIAHVCAWGTSSLAFDGSGYVKRGRQSERCKGDYSMCEFSSGKVYNCDLNASYNIGARYFIREILRSETVRSRSELEAKVPQVMKRSTCTLCSLYDLRAAMGVVQQPCVERVMSEGTKESDAPQGQPRYGMISIRGNRKHVTSLM